MLAKEQRKNRQRDVRDTDETADERRSSQVDDEVWAVLGETADDQSTYGGLLQQLGSVRSAKRTSAPGELGSTKALTAAGGTRPKVWRKDFAAACRVFAAILLVSSLFQERPSSPPPALTGASYAPRHKSTTIESLCVADKVMGNLSAGEMAGETQVDPATWRRLQLYAEAVWPDGTLDDIHIETLQPPEWVEANRASVGATVPIPLELTEMRLPADLTARVVANDPCPPIQPGPGRVVLTTVNHLNNDLYELTLATPDGHTETIIPTGLHRFYRPIDNAWVAMEDLRLGDELQGAAGPVSVRAVQKLDRVQRVYNMSVEGEHVYRVSLLGTLVHNTYPHGNSHDYIGDSHVYAIKRPDGSTFRIGESMQGVRLRDGASIRAEAQVRKLNRTVGPGHTSEIVREFGDKRSAFNHQRKLINRFRNMFGDDTLPGNLTDR